GEVEAGAGLSAAGEEPRFPWNDRGDARDAARLADVGHRVGCLWGRGGEDQIGLVGEDQLAGDLRSSVRARLGVLDDDLHVEGLAAELEPVLIGARAPHLGEYEVVAR